MRRGGLSPNLEVVSAPIVTGRLRHCHHPLGGNATDDDDHGLGFAPSDYENVEAAKRF